MGWIVSAFAAACAWLLCCGVAAGQSPPTPQLASPSPSQSAPPSTTQSDIQKLQSELEKIQTDMAAQKQAQDTVRAYLQVLASAIAAISLLAFSLQLIGFFTDARNRKRAQEETSKQQVRDDQLNTKFMTLLSVASASAEQAQRKVEDLEGSGIKRAGETLQLINNLLAITERAAAKASGAQFDFLSRSIATFDAECQKLINEATKDDDRDIVAKSEFRERVRVLTKQIESLDNQIITYNESVPAQLAAGDDAQQAGGHSPQQASAGWRRLSLTAPCLFIRGLNHHLDQNFVAAIHDWRSSLDARAAAAVSVDANYWIGYVNNTLGNYEESPRYLLAAAAIASDQRRIVELHRLELETRLFALDLRQIPESLLDEGKRYYVGLDKHRVPTRALSSFATTMGNISAVRQIRAAIAAGGDFEYPTESSHWFETALAVAGRSRWARFGICQNVVFSGGQLSGDQRKEVEDVIGSVNREFQARVEHRSKVLSKITEYICILMLGETGNESRLSTLGGLIEHLTSDVIARTIYSQFRKQNVSKDVFLEEFFYLRDTKDLRATFRMANTPKGSG